MRAFFTRRFWVLELAAIAIAAFFLASGVGELVAGAAGRELPAREIAAEPAGSPAAVEPPQEPETVRAGGVEILSRNIFDSAIGPLAGGGDRGADDADRRGPVEADEFAGEVGPCADGRLEVLATVRSESDPHESFVLLGLDGDRARCGVGDEFAGRRVEAIGWRYVLVSDERDRRCYLDLHGTSDAGRRRSGRDSTSI
jgi:hypothetical protein